jgi:Glycosyltransferase family 92
MRHLLLFLLFPSFLLASPKHYLSIMAIFRNEAPYLEEWIEYHKLVGVEHFYLYNHESTDQYLEVLAPYVQSGEVTLTDWSGNGEVHGKFRAVQLGAIDHAIKRTRGVSFWLAIIDIDEFLVPTQSTSLLPTLQKNEAYGALMIHWRIFGTSEAPIIPAGKLLTETLTRCTPVHCNYNWWAKSIIRPEAVAWMNEHVPWTMNPNWKALPLTHSNPIQLNHYWFRTENFFRETKLPRYTKWGKGSCWAGDINNILQLYDLANREKDNAILRFAPALRAKIDPHRLLAR